MTFRGVLVQHAPWRRDTVARFYIADAVTLTACSVMQPSVAAHEVGNRNHFLLHLLEQTTHVFCPMPHQEIRSSSLIGYPLIAKSMKNSQRGGVWHDSGLCFHPPSISNTSHLDTMVTCSVYQLYFSLLLQFIVDKDVDLLVVGTDHSLNRS